MCMAGVQRLVKPECFDVTTKLSQRIKTLDRPGAWITHKVVKSVLAGNHDEMSHTATEANSDNDRVTVVKVGVDERIAREIFINMPDSVGRPPGGAVPVKPALRSKASNRGEKPVQSLGVGIDSVRAKDHCGRGDGASVATDGSIYGHASERIVAPTLVTLLE